MTASVQITEINGQFVRVDPNARPIVEDEPQQSATNNKLEPILAHADRGGSYLRRLKIGQEFVGVLDAFDVCDFGFLIRSGRFAIIVPDELEVKLRPLQGRRVAILRYSDKDYSVRVLDDIPRT